MKPLSVPLAISFLVSPALTAQTLVQWDFESLDSLGFETSSPVNPETTHECITASPIDFPGTAYSNHGPGSPGGNGNISGFACSGGWSSNATFDRATHSSNTIPSGSSITGIMSLTFAFDAQASGALDRFSIDVNSSNASFQGPDSFLIDILVQDQVTGTFNIVETSVQHNDLARNQWHTITENFTGAWRNDLAGETIRIDFWGWGAVAPFPTTSQSSSVLYMDNLTLSGSVTCIPEPTSAWLLCLSSIALICRRKRSAF